jgi:hypothetical protein
MKRKRLNVWRKAGRIEFRRETRRLHDGTPWGDGAEILYCRIRGKAGAFAGMDAKGTPAWFNDGTYFKPRNVIVGAKQLRRSLLDRAREG